MLVGFLGARVRGGTLLLDPVLPGSWASLELRFRCLGRRVRVRVDAEQVHVDVDGRLAVAVGGRPREVVSTRASMQREQTRPTMQGTM